MSMIEVLVPAATAADPVQQPFAPRRPLPTGAHLTLVVNGKPKARELLGFLADELALTLPIGRVEVVQKPGASTPLAPDEAAAIAARSDLVLTGLGDCGACSACSLHDAIQIERLGTPASLVMTEVFVVAVASFAASIGAAGYPTVVVPHPVSSRDDERLRAMAREAAATAAANLTRVAEPAGASA